MNSFFIFLALTLSIFAIPAVYAETFNQSMEGGMDLEITYPESVMKQRTFSISIFLQNNGWENKEDISFILNNPDAAFVTEANETIVIDELTTTSSFGTTIDYEVTSNANEGIHFLNIDYTQVLVSNNTEPMPSAQTNIALPILVFGEPVISIETVTPESIFANSEFTFETTIISEDIDIKDTPKFKFLTLVRDLDIGSGIPPEELLELAGEEGIPNPRLQMNKMIRRGILYVHLGRIHVT